MRKKIAAPGVEIDPPRGIMDDCNTMLGIMDDCID
jgi:hypothetical protein